VRKLLNRLEEGKSYDYRELMKRSEVVAKMFEALADGVRKQAKGGSPNDVVRTLSQTQDMLGKVIKALAGGTYKGGEPTMKGMKGGGKGDHKARGSLRLVREAFELVDKWLTEESDAEELDEAVMGVQIGKLQKDVKDMLRDSKMLRGDLSMFVKKMGFMADTLKGNVGDEEWANEIEEKARIVASANKNLGSFDETIGSLKYGKGRW